MLLLIEIQVAVFIEMGRLEPLVRLDDIAVHPPAIDPGTMLPFHWVRYKVRGLTTKYHPIKREAGARSAAKCLLGDPG